MAPPICCHNRPCPRRAASGILRRQSRELHAPANPGPSCSPTPMASLAVRASRAPFWGLFLDSAAPASSATASRAIGRIVALYSNRQPGAAALPLSAPPAPASRFLARLLRHRNPWSGLGFAPLEQFADLRRRRPGDRCCSISRPVWSTIFRGGFSLARFPSDPCAWHQSYLASPAPPMVLKFEGIFSPCRGTPPNGVRWPRAVCFRAGHRLYPQIP